MHDLQKLKRINIIQVAESLNITVRSSKAFCYNGHDKLTPSLSFNRKKNTFKCFGCGDGGSTIDLVAKVLDLSVKESIEWLSKHYNFARYENHQILTPVNIQKSKPANQGNEYHEIYTWFIQQLSLSKETLDYFKGRRINKETVLEFGIKQISPGDNLLEKAKSVFPIEQLKKSGLLSKNVNKQTGEVFETLKFWNHIIFPFFRNNKVIYIQGRSRDERYSKYLNLSGVEQAIYNAEILREIEKGDTLCVCEGIMDVLSLHTLEVPAIGVLGATSFKSKYTSLLLDYNLKIISHNDKGGEAFFQTIKNAFLAEKKLVRRVYLPKQINDVNDFLIQYL